MEAANRLRTNVGSRTRRRRVQLDCPRDFARMLFVGDAIFVSCVTYCRHIVWVPFIEWDDFKLSSARYNRADRYVIEWHSNRFQKLITAGENAQ